jgi:hypothetical protein
MKTQKKKNKSTQRWAGFQPKALAYRSGLAGKNGRPAHATGGAVALPMSAPRPTRSEEAVG